MYLFPLGNLEINAFKRDLHSPIGIFSLPCTQTDPETSDVGHKVARIIRSSTIRNLEGLSPARLVVLKLNYQLFQKWKGWFLETGVKVVKLCMH